jgi:hypothetical protein
MNLSRHVQRVLVRMPPLNSGLSHRPDPSPESRVEPMLKNRQAELENC